MHAVEILFHVQKDTLKNIVWTQQEQKFTPQFASIFLSSDNF